MQTLVFIYYQLFVFINHGIQIQHNNNRCMQLIKISSKEIACLVLFNRKRQNLSKIHVQYNHSLLASLVQEEVQLTLKNKSIALDFFKKNMISKRLVAYTNSRKRQQPMLCLQLLKINYKHRVHQPQQQTLRACISKNLSKSDW